MDVDVLRLVEVGGDAEMRGTLSRITERGRCRLLHHIAECAGELQSSATVDHTDFDLERLATHRGVREPGGDANLVFQ